MKYYATSVAIAALALGTAAAQAQEKPKHTTLTGAAEAAGIVEMDGRSVDELAQAEVAPAERSDDVAPKTESEPLARETVLAEAAETFGAADTDGDDTLTEAEFVAALEPTVQTDDLVVAETETETELTTDEPTTDEGETELAAAETESETEVSDETLAASLSAKFAAIAGEDGTLSAEEMEAATVADFEAADEDGDDVLSAEERTVFASLKTGRTAS